MGGPFRAKTSRHVQGRGRARRSRCSFDRAGLLRARCCSERCRRRCLPNDVLRDSWPQRVHGAEGGRGWLVFRQGQGRGHGHGGRWTRRTLLCCLLGCLCWRQFLGNNDWRSTALLRYWLSCCYWSWRSLSLLSLQRQRLRLRLRLLSPTRGRYWCSNNCSRWLWWLLTRFRGHDCSYWPRRNRLRGLSSLTGRLRSRHPRLSRYCPGLSNQFWCFRGRSRLLGRPRLWYCFRRGGLDIGRRDYLGLPRSCGRLSCDRLIRLLPFQVAS